MRILLIGDSNTWGYNPRNKHRIERRWSRILMEMMPEHEFIEEGLNGRTLLGQDMENPQLRGIDTLNMILMTHQPVDLIVVMLGTNDLKKFFRGTARMIGKGVRAFIRAIRDPFMWERAYMPKLLVVSPILLGDNMLEAHGVCGDFDEESVRQSKYMAEHISQVCKDYGVEFMNAADHAKASEVDAIHMDEENHEKFAKAMYEKLKTML